MKFSSPGHPLLDFAVVSIQGWRQSGMECRNASGPTMRNLILKLLSMFAAYWVLKVILKTKQGGQPSQIWSIGAK